MQRANCLIDTVWRQARHTKARITVKGKVKVILFSFFECLASTHFHCFHQWQLLINRFSAFYCSSADDAGDDGAVWLFVCLYLSVFVCVCFQYQYLFCGGDASDFSGSIYIFTQSIVVNWKKLSRNRCYILLCSAFLLLVVVVAAVFICVQQHRFLLFKDCHSAISSPDDFSSNVSCRFESSSVLCSQSSPSRCLLFVKSDRLFSFVLAAAAAAACSSIFGALTSPI